VSSSLPVLQFDRGQFHQSNFAYPFAKSRTTNNPQDLHLLRTLQRRRSPRHRTVESIATPSVCSFVCLRAGTGMSYSWILSSTQHICICPRSTASPVCDSHPEPHSPTVVPTALGMANPTLVATSLGCTASLVPFGVWCVGGIVVV
jgi:hypothetical protein